MCSSIMVRSTLPLAFTLLIFSLGGLLAQSERKDNQQAKPPAPATLDEKAIEGLPSPVDLKTFKIGPEDVLMIRVWQEPQLSGPVQVRPDGVISIDLVGDLQVNGMTPEQLREKLTEKLAELVNNPLVNVQVQAVRSKKYLITGEGAAKTGEFPLVVPTTILEALIKAGGFTEWADKKKIIIMRGDKRFYFNYDEYVKKGKKPETNIYLENGDLIIVN